MTFSLNFVVALKFRFLGIIYVFQRKPHFDCTNQESPIGINGISRPNPVGCWSALSEQRNPVSKFY